LPSRTRDDTLNGEYALLLASTDNHTQEEKYKRFINAFIGCHERIFSKIIFSRLQRYEKNNYSPHLHRQQKNKQAYFFVAEAYTTFIYKDIEQHSPPAEGCQPSADWVVLIRI
jgi:hypothetical protein